MLLTDVLLVPSLKKSILSVCCMIYVHQRVAFEGEHCTINDCSLSSLRTFARGVREGGLYELLVDLVALVNSSEKLDYPSIIEEACAYNSWQDAIETGPKPIVELVINYKTNVSVIHYRAKVTKLHQIEDVDHDVTLA